MAMTRGTALVTNIAGVVKLTGLQDLANLESDGELTITDLLVTASDAIFDQLEGDGIDPTKLINEFVFERAVAWHFVAMLVKLEYVPIPEGLDPPTDPYTWSDIYYNRVRGKFLDGVESRRPNEALPIVGNINRKGLLDPSQGIAGSFWDDRPTRR